MIMILWCRNLWHNKTMVQGTSVAREMTRTLMMVCLSNSERERVGGTVVAIHVTAAESLLL